MSKFQIIDNNQKEVKVYKWLKNLLENQVFVLDLVVVDFGCESTWCFWLTWDVVMVQLVSVGLKWDFKETSKSPALLTDIVKTIKRVLIFYLTLLAYL